ncbi:MAG: hypothetical protein HFG70_07735 [Hungatella sp.]|nr:hypothetical protein [Hungatella sp.]MCI9531066.1 hypothetical protein [Lachnospiraceae bacterium]
MAHRNRCARCGCYMDSGEGVNYPGEGRVCEECRTELEEEEGYRKRWALTKEEFLELKKDMPGLIFRGTA